jgi:hypothetical protein
MEVELCKLQETSAGMLHPKDVIKEEAIMGSDN